ncbi:DUF3052 domain-containing protein [Streptomyces sp. NPDC001586]|uniref:DUF3052 domain-containing protein n=1 Tax=Streptomyces sp. NPDC001586 TaxID=3154387 RepID=UPI003328C799
MTSTVSIADKLGIEPKTVVQELGWSEDCDEVVRESVEQRSGSELLDEDSDGVVVDVVLLWWRDDDGDLVDALTGAVSQLADSGTIWLITPKTGHDGYVEPDDIAEAIPTAGLAKTSSTSVGDNWTGIRLALPKTASKHRG